MEKAAANLPARAGQDFFIDGHLDLGTLVELNGRDLVLPIEEIRRAQSADNPHIATVSLPAIRAGRIGIVFATLWALPANIDIGVGASGLLDGPLNPYSTPEEAEALGLAQIDLYHRWEAEGRVRILRTKADLADHLLRWPQDSIPGFVILMEGADPIVQPRDVSVWKERGLRIVGPSWGRTRYAGGTGAPGGLTAEGRELVCAIREADLILDTSHLSDESFDEAMALLGPGKVIASHSAARSIVPGDRQLSDGMIEAIGRAGGIVGIPLYNRFLDSGWNGTNRRPVTAVDQFRAHVVHVASLIGWDKVAIGSDLDGGFGRNETLEGIETIADFGAIGDAFKPEEAHALLGGNWLRLLEAWLPD